MSGFSHRRKEIEPDVAKTVVAMKITGTPPDLMALLSTLAKMQPKTGGDPYLTLVNALLCEAAIKRWLEAFEATCDEVEARLN